MISPVKNSLLPLLIGVILGFSCIHPDTFYAPLGALISLLGLWYIFHSSQRPALYFFYAGVSFHFTSMWWIGSTIEKFGGFHPILANILLLLYCLLSSVQFLLSAYIGRRYFKYLEQSILPGLSLVMSWTVLEIVFPRLFPWGLGNFFIHLKSFVSLAEYVGAQGLSFLVLIISALFYKELKSIFIDRSFSSARFFAHVSPPLILLIIGYLADRSVANEILLAEQKTAIVVQGNLDIHEKGALSYFEANLKRYQGLSEDSLKSSEEKDIPIDFIIWPETVMNKWTPSFLSRYTDISYDPFPGLEVPLLYGTLAYFLEEGQSQAKALTYNAAIVRSKGGIISSFYAKRILMPFGEYIPFVETFPWLRKIVPMQGGFTKGAVELPIQIPVKEGEDINAGILICYEDLSAQLSREYAMAGAQVLINLTNDAWYGNSPAPYQHDLLARFRSIETRRAMIRSTNTGYTTLITPRGEIENHLPLFEEATGIFKFPLLERETIYARHGDVPLYIILGVLFLLMGIWSVFKSTK